MQKEFILANRLMEVRFGEFFDTAVFQWWKTNLKIEICSCSGCLNLGMLWMKAVEVAKSVDDIMTSRSIEWHIFFDFEMRRIRLC